MRLRDKTAIVTGAGSGLGEGIARRFLAEVAQGAVMAIEPRPSGIRVNARGPVAGDTPLLPRSISARTRRAS